MTDSVETYRIAVLGPGAVGGFLAALLCRKYNSVTCIARKHTADILRAKGLRLNSDRFGDFIVRPQIVEQLEEPVDLLFIATKSTGLTSALSRISQVDLSNTLVVPLLNGIEHIDFLRAQINGQILAGSIRISARIVEAGYIEHSTDFSIITLASDQNIEAFRINMLKTYLEQCGVTVKVNGTEAEVLWGKLVRLNALACTTALSDATIGYVRQNVHLYEMLCSIVVEGALVAKAAGAEINSVEELNILNQLPSDLTSSMRDDIAGGVPSELNAIAGAVVRAGKRYNIACPVTEKVLNTLTEKILSTQ